MMKSNTTMSSGSLKPNTAYSGIVVSPVCVTSLMAVTVFVIGTLCQYVELSVVEEVNPGNTTRTPVTVVVSILRVGTETDGSTSETTPTAATTRIIPETILLDVTSFPALFADRSPSSYVLYLVPTGIRRQS